MPRPLAFVLLFLLAALPAAADTLLTVRSTVEGLKLDQAQQGPVRIWIDGRGDKVRRDEGDTSYVLRLDRGKLYVINHADKTFSELALPIDPGKIPAPEAAQVKAQVTPAGETKKIGSWNASKYKVDISSPAGVHLDTILWASKDVASYPALGRLAVSIAALQPGSADWARKLAGIEGFPVLQEVDVTMGANRFKTRDELVSVETRDAPAGSWDPPAGYTAQPFGGGQ
jgi:hypothetical protein